MPCVFCGYDLRHLDPAGQCPECGRPIARSLRGSEIAASDPRWVAKLCGGVSAFLIALPVFWLPLAWPVAWWGAWRMTTPDPRQGHTLKTQLLRWLLVVLIPATPLAAMYSTGGGRISLTVLTMGMAAALLTCGGIAADHLVRRAGGPGLRRLDRIAGGCVLGGLAASVALYAIDAIQALAAGDALPIPAAHWIPLLLGTLVALLLQPVLLIWLWKTLDAAQFQAATDTRRLMAFVRGAPDPPATAST